MKKINQLLLSIITILTILPACNTQPPALSDFQYGSASVLPFYNLRRTKYVILSREKWGRDAGTYDDFGGKRDQGENHPVISAAREFWEEAILDGTVGLSLARTQNYIDITQSRNTHYVVANTTRRGAKNVTYITNFNKYKTQFINNFYKARRNSTKRENKEKDRIAIVKWQDLKDAIVNNQHNSTSVYVSASVINPITNKGEQQQILLRPYLVIKLRNFFRDQPHTKGRSKKIQFYS